MNRKIILILGAIVVFILAAGAGKFGRKITREFLSPKKLTSEQIEGALIAGLEKGLKEYRGKLPMMLDKDTRLDKATIKPGPRVEYHHTFVNYTSEDIDPKVLLSSLKPAVTERICNSKKTKSSLQYGATFIYSYSGKDKIKIVSIELDRRDCGFPRIGP